MKPDGIENVAPVEFEITYHGDKFKVKIEGVSPEQDPSKPRKFYVNVNGKLEEVQLQPLAVTLVGRSGTLAAAAAAPVGSPAGRPRPEKPGDVAPPMPGKVSKILVNVGDQVKKVRLLQWSRL